MTTRETIKSAFESMLFVWGQPLPLKDAADVFDISAEEAEGYFTELAREYEDRSSGLVIRRVGDAFQLVTRGENEEFIRRLCTPVKIRKLSQAALEVLAIIAYRQPVTKGEIDAVRGIRSDRVIEGLMEKDLVRAAGRANAIGRPIIYRTTDTFLKQFGFSSLDELPEIEDIEGAVSSDGPDEETTQLTMEMEISDGNGND